MGPRGSPRAVGWAVPDPDAAERGSHVTSHAHARLATAALALCRGRSKQRYAANTADAEAAEASTAGEDSWSMVFCLWLLNPAVVFTQLSSKVCAC